MGEEKQNQKLKQRQIKSFALGHTDRVNVELGLAFYRRFLGDFTWISKD